MKLPLLPTIVLLFSRPPRRLPRAVTVESLFAITKTLSALANTPSPITKKPASLAGFRYLGLGITRLTPPFSSRSPSRTYAALLHLTIQTPNSL